MSYRGVLALVHLPKLREALDALPPEEIPMQVALLQHYLGCVSDDTDWDARKPFDADLYASLHPCLLGEKGHYEYLARIDPRSGIPVACLPYTIRESSDYLVDRLRAC